MSGNPAIETQLLRKPEWLKVRPPGGAAYARLKSAFRSRNLHTVCEEAQCPNIAECWGGGTATFMLLGDTCTRGCRFCAVRTGNPRGRVDPDEPEKLADAVAEMLLDYAVITMVDRDDLPDGGADHVARCVERLKTRAPRVRVELLVGDFQGDPRAIDRIVRCGADVLAHNIETTEPLTPTIRDRRCSYRRSLDVLSMFKSQDPHRLTKSSIMLGLGEAEADVLRACADLRRAGVDILTLGQYLRPSHWHTPVVEYLSPARFDRFRETAEAMGFRYVASGPLVRSSYRAGELFTKNLLERRSCGGEAGSGGGCLDV
jgi:lipoic acid synthetase